MFTLDLCVLLCMNVIIKFNIVSMENVKNRFRQLGDQVEAENH